MLIINPLDDQLVLCLPVGELRRRSAGRLTGALRGHLDQLEVLTDVPLVAGKPSSQVERQRRLAQRAELVEDLAFEHRRRILVAQALRQREDLTVEQVVELVDAEIAGARRLDKASA